MSALDTSPIDRRRLQAILNRAATVFNRAVIAYERDRFNTHHAQALQEQEGNVSYLLALFDRYGHGVFCPDTIEGMRDYQQDAEQLLVETCMTLDDRRDDWSRLDNNQYLCRRFLKIDGKLHTHCKLCNNPAVGFSRLDQWEAKLRSQLELAA